MLALIQMRLRATEHYLGVFPGYAPTDTATVEPPCDTELSQEIEKKRLPLTEDDKDRIWKAVRDVARGL